jgi:hypothetical protein
LVMKRKLFSQNKNFASECIFFSYNNVASTSFYNNKIHPNANKWNVIHVYTVMNLINNLISPSFCSQLFKQNGCKYKIQYY